MKFIEVCGAILIGVWIGFCAIFCNGLMANLVAKHFILLDRYGQVAIVAAAQLALFILAAICVQQAGVLRRRAAVIRAVNNTEHGKEILKDIDYDLRDDVRHLTR